MKDAHALSLETSLGVAMSCSPLPLCRRKGPGKEVRECVNADACVLMAVTASHSAGPGGALAKAVTSPSSGAQ